MIIGYDGKRAVQNNTGLGNYSRLLVEKMATSYPEHRYLLYAPRKRENRRMATIHTLANVEMRYPTSASGRLFPSLWRTWSETHDLHTDRVELFHGLSGELPLNIHKAHIPTVVTIHDLIFRRIPENYRPIDRYIYDYKFRRAATTATRIIAISNCTKNDIVTAYGIDPGKIDVVYQGCDTQFLHQPEPETVAAVRRKYGLDRPYIISVGTLEPRKNQLQAVRGLAALPTDMDLVLVGRRSDYARTRLDPEISSLNLDGRVKYLEGIPFPDLPALYAGAELSSYTSRYEGFGLPVVESLSVGTPVIVATGSCLEEAGGPATPAIDPDSTEQWAVTARKLLDDTTYRQHVATGGKTYVGRFSHDNMARQIMESYRKAIDRFGSHTATH